MARVLSDEDDEDESSELPPTLVTTRGFEKNGNRWNHIENLDDFFIRVYKYHQEQGFVCLLLSDVFSLIQYVFIVLFATFLAVCVDYDILFNKNPTFSEVINWSKFNLIPSGLIICLVVAFAFWTVRLIKVIHNGFKAWEIRHFFHHVLHITDQELQNMQWRDVQHKLVEVQQVHQMCIHKKDLTELDIHHRILRQKNYFIALQNKGVISCVYRFPIVGNRGPGAPFEKSWKLKTEYKDYGCRTVLSNTLSRRIFLLGIANLILCPFVFIYQVLHSFFKYAELIKRSPDSFGARRWSHYGRLYLRHFNEMDHEFHSRLSKAYDPATRYMNSFVSPIITILARNIAFFCGALLAVLLGLSFYDQDVLTAEHVISAMATLGIIIKVCAGFIPDEVLMFCIDLLGIMNVVYHPETLMKQILSHTHYIPDEWKGRSHTTEVREEFSRLFQYKFVNLLEELMSPLLTPFILCFHLPYKSQQIVDFYRNFTVDVIGVGDVCSFAQMDVRKHGNNRYVVESKEDQMLSAEQQAENGKTELSLLHFSFKNPEWRPTDSGKHFIETIKEHAIQESLSMSQSFPLHRSLSLQGFPNPNYIGSTNDITTFIGLQTPLQSLAQPSIDSSELRVQQQDAILNTSILYLRDIHERQGSSSYPTSSVVSVVNGEPLSDEDHPPLIQRSWPTSTDIPPVQQHPYVPSTLRWNEEESHQ